MKLSVIIISYMFEDYIEQSLISALGQKTNFDYEILVRDDFSSDNSLQHIKRIAELNERIKFFEPDKNLGPNKNFEFLYSKAKGEYVAILDGDDYWDNMDHLQKSIDYLDNNPDTSMVFCGYREKIVNENNRINPFEITEWLGITDNKNITTENFLLDNYVGFGKVFRKIENLIESWMYELPYLDWGINFSLSYHGKIKYLDFPGGIYRIHNQGIFSSEDEEKRKYNIKKSKEIIKINYENKMKKISIILHCTENYLQNSLNLVKSLNLYHNNLDFYLYTLNFKYNSEIPNLTTVPVESLSIENDMSFVGNKNDVSNKNMFKSVFFKSKVVLHTLEHLNLDQAIYIDSDMVPTGDISELFKYFDQVEDYPLIQQGLFEYQINYGRGNPFHNGGFDETNILEYPLMKMNHIPVKNRTHYSVTSVMVYNKKCKQFFKEYDWLNEFAFNLDLEEIKFYYPFSDETTMNVLLWKYKYNKRLPFLQMNIDDINNVKEYYESNYENEKEVTSYVRVPSKEKRRDILFFHGAKGELSNEIMTLQNNVFNSRIDLEENRYYISSNIDFDRELSIIFYDGDNVIYSSESHIKKGIEYWFSPDRHLNTVNSFELNVKIYDGCRLIYKKM